MKKVAFLADIFKRLNNLNMKMQGRDTYIMKFLDILRAFVAKIQNWRHKVNSGNAALFEKLKAIIAIRIKYYYSFFENENMGSATDHKT